ncbi:hypothetical protein K439DRAFT_1617579 [Ramaria rubella]|nr:hypothetical protein K439DRAFT_1617579 [Ramaria rubella]
MLSYLPTLPSRHQYKLVATLKGHQDAINSLALSMTGNILASGGDGVKLWDIQSKTQLTTLKQNLLARGPMIQMNIWAMARLWVIWSSGLRILEIMTYGIYCSKGNFEEITAKRLGTGCELTCITHNPVCDARPRIAIATHGQYGASMEGRCQGNIAFRVFCATQWDCTKSNAPNKEFLNKDILVFGLFDGNMHVLRGEMGKSWLLMSLDQEYHTYDPSGSAAISNKCNQCVIDNTTDGFDLYWLGNGAYIRTFNTGKPRRNVPKQVTFGEDGKAIVGGSDHGVAYVFDQVKGTT